MRPRDEIETDQALVEHNEGTFEEWLSARRRLAQDVGPLLERLDAAERRCAQLDDENLQLAERARESAARLRHFASRVDDYVPEGQRIILNYEADRLAGAAARPKFEQPVCLTPDACSQGQQCMVGGGCSDDPRAARPERPQLHPEFIRQRERATWPLDA